MKNFIQKLIITIVVLTFFNSTFTYGTNNTLRSRLMSSHDQRRFSQAEEASGQMPFGRMSQHEQLRHIKLQPRISGKIRFLMDPFSFIRHFCMTQRQFNALDGALALIDAGKTGEIDNEYGPLVSSAIANGYYYLRSRDSNAVLSIEERLRALTQAAKRIVHKVVKGVNTADPVSIEHWKQFITKTWDVENKAINTDVKDALFEHLDYLFRTKSTFGQSSYYKPIRGRATPAQVASLNRAVASGVDEIEYIVNLWPEDTVRGLADNNITEREATIERLRKGIRPKKQESKEEDMQLAMERRLEVVEALRNFWMQGYVPYGDWLKRNHHNIYSLAIRKTVFGGDIKIAYRAADLPLDIIVRTAAGSGFFRRVKDIAEQEWFAQTILTFDDVRIEVLNKEDPLAVLVGLRVFQGNWIRAIKATRNQVINMPILPDVISKSIERIATEAGVQTVATPISRTIAEARRLRPHDI